MEATVMQTNWKQSSGASLKPWTGPPLESYAPMLQLLAQQSRDTSIVCILSK